MLHTRQDVTFRDTIASEFIRNDHSRDVLQPFDEFPKEAFGGFFISPALHQDVEYVAILIHGAPEILSFATNGEEDLIHVPDVSAARTATTQFIGIGLAEFQAPLTYRFIRHDDPALRDAGADVWYDEHNLTSGQLMELVQRELSLRPCGRHRLL